MLSISEASPLFKHIEDASASIVWYLAFLPVAGAHYVDQAVLELMILRCQDFQC